MSKGLLRRLNVAMIPTIHSVLKLSTGFAIAAFIAWKLTVSNAINIAATPAIKNIHQLILIL